MTREKRTVNNTTFGDWDGYRVAGALESDALKTNDDRFKNARKWFNTPSYYQSKTGRLTGGMRGKCKKED
jgi:hypothetical protein